MIKQQKIIYSQQLINNRQTKMGTGQSNNPQHQQFITRTIEYWRNYYNNKQPEEFHQLMDMFNVQLSKCSCSTCCRKDQFCLSLQEGRGIVFRQGKSFYYGAIVNSRPEGQGHIYYHSRIAYRGQFLAGLPHGQGQLYLVHRGQQLIQDGIWANGKMISGQITPTADSNVSKIKLISPGDYEITYKSGQVYFGKGFIENNQFYREGIGILEHKRTRYEGQWKRNKRQGQGQMITERGIFKGFFKDDKKWNGSFRTDFNQYQGIWQDGVLFSGEKKRIDTGDITQILNNVVVRSSLSSLPGESRMR